MELRTLHSWDVTPVEAREIQKLLAPQVSASGCPRMDEVRYVVGLDMSAPDHEGVVTGAAVALTFPELEPVDAAVGRIVPPMPYVPGLLSFRQTPALAVALEGLRVQPDLIIVDGHGTAHPRRFGIACHIGLAAQTPTIGCAKSILVGEYGELGQERGSRTPLMHKGEVIGMAVRTRTGVSPVFVSVGHMIELDSAVEWTLAACKRFRQPETTRNAHNAAAGRPPILARADIRS